MELEPALEHLMLARGERRLRPVWNPEPFDRGKGSLHPAFVGARSGTSENDGAGWHAS